MEIARRRLASNEIDYELIWLIVSVTALGLAAGWRWVGLPWPSCLFHDVTGLPCVTCGATRATTEFLHGRFLAALEWNPLVFAILCAMVALNLYAAAVLFARVPRVRLIQFTPSEKKTARIMLIAAAVSNWIYLLSHSTRY